MESSGNSLLIQGMLIQLAVHGKTLRLQDGSTRICLISKEPQIGLETMLGNDGREKMTVSLLKPIPAIMTGQSEAVMVEDQQRIKLTARDDNPGSPFAEFDAVKVVEGKDQ